MVAAMPALNNGNAIKYPWNDLKVGEYFTTLCAAPRKQYQQTAANMQKRTGKRFVVIYPWKGSEVAQVWRTA